MEKRWKEHVREAYYGSSRHFHNAINLYGKDNWYHEVLIEGVYTFTNSCKIYKGVWYTYTNESLTGDKNIGVIQ